MKQSSIQAIILLLLLLVTCVDVEAQRGRGRGRQLFRAYPSFGATVSQMRGDELRGYDKGGFTAGVGAMMALDRDGAWNASIEADFTQRGAQNKSHNPYRLEGLTMNYVDIPLSVHFTDPYGGITLGLGLVYSRLVQQPHGTLYYTPDSFIPDTSDMSFLKNDFSALFDVRFPIWRGLTLNFRLQLSLLPIKKNWGFTEYPPTAPTKPLHWTNNCYNNSISLRLLYLFGDNRHKKHIPYKSHSKKNKRRR